MPTPPPPRRWATPPASGCGSSTASRRSRFPPPAPRGGARAGRPSAACPWPPDRWRGVCRPVQRADVEATLIRTWAQHRRGGVRSGPSDRRAGRLARASDAHSGRIGRSHGQHSRYAESAGMTPVADSSGAAGPPDVEIVIPVRNEQHDVAPSVRRLHAHLAVRFPFPTVITIADNGSTDDTWAIATELATQLPGVH